MPILYLNNVKCFAPKIIIKINNTLKSKKKIFQTGIPVSFAWYQLHFAKKNTVRKKVDT